MSAPVIQAGAGLSLSPEMAVQQVLLEHLHFLAGDEALMSQVFGRTDDLLQGSAEDQERDFRKDFLTILDQGLRVIVGWPSNEAVLPCIAVALQPGGEDQGEARVGNIFHRKGELVGVLDEDNPTLGKVYEHTVQGRQWNTSLQIGAWSTAPELSSLLHGAARAALLHGEGDLFPAGVREITSIQESGLSVQDSDKFPHVEFVPLSVVQIAWTLRTTRRSGPKPFRVVISTPVTSIG